MVFKAGKDEPTTPVDSGELAKTDPQPAPPAKPKTLEDRVAVIEKFMRAQGYDL